MTAARIYTPDPDGACMVCWRPRGEHARDAWSAPSRSCPPAEVTAETVTPEQIIEYGMRCTRERDSEGRETAQIAIGDLPGFTDAYLARCRARIAATDAYRARCRARIAAAINARAKGGR